MQARADFRSDTMTVPTPAMRAAMAAAAVGDDVWGEDPTVRELEGMGAALLGMEAALFVPSGTMANQIAIHLHCRAGDELICEERSHVYVNEGGGIARWSGTQVKPLAAADGFPTPAQVEAAVRADDVHYPRSRLLVLENTHNSAGGRVAAPERVEALAAAARRHGLAVHCDGARLYNAAVAIAGCRLADLVAPLDSTTLCLSKGLGAPVGSLLAGRDAFVREARRARKAFGGGMRQAGVIAAAGILALRAGPELLRADHGRAKRLAQGLAGLPWARVDVAGVETNIVMLETAVDLSALLAHLAGHGVLASKFGPQRLRFVLHRDLTDAHVEQCLAACRAFAPAAARPPSPSSIS
jgi:threonine aldolase